MNGTTPLRIATIVGPFPSHSETFVESQILGLLERGHAVDVYAGHAEATAASAALEGSRILERTTWAPAMPKARLRRIASGLQLVARYGRRNPRALGACVDVRRHGRRAARLELLHSVVPLVDGPPYDIVHCHFGSNGIYGQLLKSLGLALRLAVTFYGNDVLRYVRAHGARCYVGLFEQADLVLALSRRMRSQLIGYGADPVSTVVHRLGIDPARFRFAPRTLAADEPIRVTTTARLAPTKGLSDAIEAIASLRARQPRLRLEIIGDGPMRGELTALVDRLGVRDVVSMPGWMPQAEVARRLEASHVFMLPSVTTEEGDEEGTPTAIIEALATGLPVLSTWHSGIPELVEDGVSGYLTPQRRPDALAQRLEMLITQPERWPAMGRAGRRAVEARHDIDVLNGRLAEHFGRVCGRGTASSSVGRVDAAPARRRAA